MKKNNIIFLFSDQQRWDTLGCYGQPLPITPNLDTMAAAGTRFHNTFTCQPVCGPARACLQTGKYATEVGCPTNHKMPPADEMKLAPLLNDAGYETAYIGKWHLASFGPHDGPDNFRTKPVPVERRGGYDYWLASDCLEFTSHGYDGHMFDGDGNKREFPEGRYRVDAHTDWIIEYLKNRNTDKPYFLFASYIEPHHQNDHKHFEGPHGSKEKFKDFAVPGDLEGTEGNWREEYPDYLGCCHSLDANVGRILKTVRELGEEENTIIFYTADHGCHFNTRIWEYKRACHDSCLRIPLVAAGPGFSGGVVKDELVSLIDMPPTILTAAGVTPPETMHGRPLQQLMNGADDWAQSVFAQISESQVGRTVRTARWKYSVKAPDHAVSEIVHGIVYKDADSSVYVEDYLYDLEADPHERNNLVAEPALADVRAEMKKLLLEHMRTAHERAAEIVPVKATDDTDSDKVGEI